MFSRHVRTSHRERRGPPRLRGRAFATLTAVAAAAAVAVVAVPTTAAAGTGPLTNLSQAVTGPVATQTQLQVDPYDSSPAGTQQTLFASVSPDAAGTVQFKDGTESIGTPVALTHSFAMLSTTLSQGDHSLSAVFVPDDPTAFTSSASSPVAYHVNPPLQTTTTQLTVTPDGVAAPGAEETLVATVSPTLSGTVTFYSGSRRLSGPVDVVDGVARYTTTLSNGHFSLTAAFTPNDENYAASASTPVIYHVGSPASPTTMHLEVGPASPAPVGTKESFSVTISPGRAVLDGKLQFYDGSTPLGSPITLGEFTGVVFQTTLAPGDHSLSAVFTPRDLQYTGSTSETVPYHVGTVAQTATATHLDVSPTGPAPSGTNEMLTATVNPAAAGTVQFLDGTTPLGGPVTVTGSTASMGTTLVPGNHSLSAVFTSTDPGFVGSTSDAVSYTVSTATPTPTTTVTQLSVAPGNPATAGTQETLTATVSPTAAGTVQFLDGTTPLGSPVTVTGSTASMGTTLVPGNHSLSAVFTSTDPGFVGSTSDPVSYTVSTATPTPTTTATQLSVAPGNPATAGTQETLTATVSPTAAGTVQFLDGTTPLGGPVTVTGSTASMGTTLAPGNHSLSAVFTSADPAMFTGSTSNPVSYTVGKAKADIRVQVSAQRLTATRFAVTVTTTNNGPLSAREVLTSVMLPKGLRAVSAPGGAISPDGTMVAFRTASLAAAGSVTATVNVTAASSARRQQTITGGAVSFYTPDPRLGNNTAKTVVRVG